MFILKIFFFFILLILIFYFQKNVRILYFLDFLLLAPGPVLTGGFLLRLETKEPQTTQSFVCPVSAIEVVGYRFILVYEVEYDPRLLLLQVLNVRQDRFPVGGNKSFQ